MQAQYTTNIDWNYRRDGVKMGTDDKWWEMGEGVIEYWPEIHDERGNQKTAKVDHKRVLMLEF